MVAITGFTHKYLLDVYKIPKANASLYQGTDVKRFFSQPERKAEASALPGPRAARAFHTLDALAHMRSVKAGLLVDAFARVVKSYPDAFLTLVGKNGRDGDIEGELKAAVKAAGLEANVAFHPFIRSPCLA